MNRDISVEHFNHIYYKHFENDQDSCIIFSDQIQKGDTIKVPKTIGSLKMLFDICTDQPIKFATVDKIIEFMTDLEYVEKCEKKFYFKIFYFSSYFFLQC